MLRLLVWYRVFRRMYTAWLPVSFKNNIIYPKIRFGIINTIVVVLSFDAILFTCNWLMVQFNKLLSHLYKLPLLTTLLLRELKKVYDFHFRWVNLKYENELTMEMYLKSTEKKRHYCSMCSNYTGSYVDGQSIILHKFPTHITLQKTWIRRVRTVMPKFIFNKNSRLCSAHFVGGEFYRGL